MSAIAVRDTALEKMKHAIGFTFNKVEKNKYIAYRNYYATPRSDDNDWKYLVSIGYAQLGDITENCIYYHVTEKGINFIEQVTGIKIEEDD